MQLKVIDGQEIGKMYKWGCQVPNGEFTPADVTDVFGDGVYVVMQENFGRLAVSSDGSPGLRDRAPKALILARFYLENWYTTSAARWATQINDLLFQVNASDPSKRRNVDLIDCYTWANEQNLKHESAGMVGAPGIVRGDYEKILEWNMDFLTAADDLPMRDVLRVFPALAMGNSDDQDDGAGVGLEILQPVIRRCQYGSMHPYWNSGLRLDDEWRGLGRIHKQLPFFNGLPIIAKETGNFAVDRTDAAQQYLDAGYYMQGIEQICGFAFFIFADPTKKHQQNDMSRNTSIYDAIRRATKTPRAIYVAPEGVPVPETPPDSPITIGEPSVLNDAPQTTARKLLVGYQVWQWSQAGLPRNYDELKTAMQDTGALILADKYSDSSALQGEFDSSPFGVKSIAVMRERRQWCDDNGYLYIPWDVPRAIPINSNAFEGARQEALFHARVCNEVGLKYRISDLEFYKSFFGYDLEQRGGRSFFNSMQERNDAAELYYRTFAENSDTLTILQPDLRQWDTIEFHRLAPYISAIVGQSYAAWFRSMGDRRTHAQIVQDFLDKSEALKVFNEELKIGLSLYCDIGTEANTTQAEARELCQQAVAAGAEYLIVYKAPVEPVLNGVTRAFAKLSLEDTADVDTIEKITGEAWGLGEDAEAMAVKYMNLGVRARALGYGWMANGYDAANKALDAASLAAKTATKAPKES